MKNFGFEELLLVDAPELDPGGEAYGFAGQAREDILPNHTRLSFEELTTQYYTVGFTDTTNEDATSHVRFPFITPTELHEELSTVTAPTALVFGREANGLTNDELAVVDRVCSIPASSAYPALNLGQAVTVTLYELRELALAETQLPDVDRHRADEADIERFYKHFEQYLAAIEHPPEKRPKTMRLIRRVIGRAHPTDREIRTLTGIIRRGHQFVTGPSERSDETTS